ncbi:MAG TPA: FecR domain-containing protein [Rhodanobacter sp.]|nr:FecR domain-containing protein [Rhodanobacter sp.]
MAHRVWGQLQLSRWLFAVSLAVAFAPVAAAPLADWNYRVRPNDTIWDLAGHYLKPDVPWQKLQDYNHVADPLHLPPGMTLHIPVAWLRMEPAKAKVIAVIGNATATSSGNAQPMPVTQGMSFGYGATLVTQGDTSLTLEFADGSRILVLSNSELSLDRLSAYGNTGMVDTRLRLQHGRINSDVTPMNGSAARFSVSTPGTISSVRGTHFRVIADAEAGTARTEVTSGKVDVGNDKRHVLVKTGLGVATADGASPGQPRSLLPAPTPPCPTAPIHQFPFEFQWNAVAGAQHYRVQVARSAKFEALLLDRIVDDTRTVIPDMSDGTYAIRVHGIGTDKLEGLDATCATVTIDGHPQPPLIVSPQPDTKVRDTRPQFRWTESQQAVSYTWQLASDPAFEHMLAEQSQVTGGDVRPPNSLPFGRYYWRIASRDGAGKVGPYTHALPFDLVPEPASPVSGEPKRSHGDLVLSWSAGTPGQRYHVQVARNPAFTQPEVDTTLDEPEIDLKKLSSGKWYVHVQTIDTDGYAGPWGSPQNTRIPCMACRWAAAGGGAALLWLVL